MKVQLTSTVDLARVTWSRQQVKMDYHGSDIVSVWQFEGHWQYASYPHTPFSIQRVDTAGFSNNFLNEIVRLSHLHEVGDLELFEIQVHTGMMTRCYRDQRDLKGFNYSLTGLGRHSRIMYDASEFKADGVLDQAGLMVLQDVLQQYMGMNVEEILERKS